MKIKLTEAARNHLRMGYQFYERQTGGLGSYFLNSIMADIDSLKIHAGVHAIAFDRYQRMVSRRFPYSIYYRIEGDDIRIRAVLDDRRNPVSIQQFFADSSNH